VEFVGDPNLVIKKGSIWSLLICLVSSWVQKLLGELILEFAFIVFIKGF
jgi:hypothetical protein